MITVGQRVTGIERPTCIDYLNDFCEMKVLKLEADGMVKVKVLAHDYMGEIVGDNYHVCIEDVMSLDGVSVSHGSGTQMLGESPLTSGSAVNNAILLGVL